MLDFVINTLQRMKKSDGKIFWRVLMILLLAIVAVYICIYYFSDFDRLPAIYIFLTPLTTFAAI